LRAQPAVCAAGSIKGLKVDHVVIQSARLQRLQKLAQHVRHVAVSRQGDLNGWRVSRMLREANTPSEADEAERQFEVWAIGPSGSIKMHTPTFAARQTAAGWVIDATTANGAIEQLLGLFISEDAATRWIADHPADWWKLRTASSDELLDGLTAS
jgi:hypothetical protein